MESNALYNLYDLNIYSGTMFSDIESLHEHLTGEEAEYIDYSNLWVCLYLPTDNVHDEVERVKISSPDDVLNIKWNNL